ncbi:MAG: RNA polymerase sigma-70 factor [Thermomicrobiales bacterium]
MPETVIEDVETFDAHRALLFAVAYRMVGSVMDAEDIVQEAYLRWQRREETDVQSPKAYLSTIVTRLSIDHLRAAHTQRESYTGTWLPEPLLTEPEPDVADTVALHESLSLAFLVLLENLTPVERAIFLLHDIFAYDFHEIAGMVGKSEANCRQLARRARQQIQARRPRFDPSPERQQRLTQQFIAACTSGDLSSLLATLADDATFWGDGGGKARAPFRPIEGAERIAAFILGIMRNVPEAIQVRPATVNGQPGFLFLLDGAVYTALALDIVDGRIQAMYAIANPDKLRAVDTGGSA